jgi:small-conductance mechanosensitive channel
MNDSMYTLILFLAAVAAGLIAYLVLSFSIRRMRKSRVFKQAQIFSSHLRHPLKFLLPALFVASMRSWLRVPQDFRAVVDYAVEIWIIAVVAWLAVKVVHAVRDIIMSRYDIEAADNLQARRIYTQLRVIGHILSALIVLFAVAFTLLIFPKVRQIGVSLLASAGIVGVILGFAAQKTLGNFIAGIQLAFAQPIRIDDVVIVENEWGWIEEITLTYVVMRIWDLRRLVIPISYFVEKPFQNWTRISADLLGTVFIYADYTIPVQEVRGELTRILEASPHWDRKVNVLQVTDATDRTVQLRALMSAKDSPTAWDLRCEVREKLLQFLQQRFPRCLPRVRIDDERAQEGAER